MRVISASVLLNSLRGNYLHQTKLNLIKAWGHKGTGVNCCKTLPAISSITVHCDFGCLSIKWELFPHLLNLNWFCFFLWQNNRREKILGYFWACLCSFCFRLFGSLGPPCEGPGLASFRMRNHTEGSPAARQHQLPSMWARPPETSRPDGAARESQPPEWCQAEPTTGWAHPRCCPMSSWEHKVLWRNSSHQVWEWFCYTAIENQLERNTFYQDFHLIFPLHFSFQLFLIL